MVASQAPLHSDNPLKLGVFCFNAAGGASITSAEGAPAPTWEENLRIARAADRAGWEFLLPIGRWRGFGGVTNFNGPSFEVYTWAAGLAAATSRIQVFATSHVPLMHPVLAAKQAATIDHISGGRFGVNVVAGWNTAELAMFGVEQLDHDERYRAADEWLTLVKRLWTEAEEFDFDGAYFHVKRGYMMPKPIQQPHPIVVSAGSSPAGMRFGAKHADFIFQVSPDIEAMAELNQRVKSLAWSEFRRRVGTLNHCYVVCADTEREAQRYLRYYVDERGDWQAAQGLVDGLIAGKGESFPPEVVHHLQRELIAGWAGCPMVGTPEQIVDRLARLHKSGTDGVALSWVDYEAGIDQFNAQVVPLLVQAGLRKA